MKDASDMQDDEFVEEEEDGNPAAPVKKLREKLKKAVEEKQEYLEGWQRARAEFVNYKKEESARNERKEERLRGEFAEAILPTLDTLWFAIKSPAFENASVEWQKGIQHSFDELQRSLKKFGIETIIGSSNHEAPDVTRFEVIREEPSDNEDLNGLIKETYRLGLNIQSHVIRPAQVSIYKFIEK